MSNKNQSELKSELKIYAIIKSSFSNRIICFEKPFKPLILELVVIKLL